MPKRKPMNQAEAVAKEIVSVLKGEGFKAATAVAIERENYSLALEIQTGAYGNAFIVQEVENGVFCRRGACPNEQALAVIKRTLKEIGIPYVV